VGAPSFAAFAKGGISRRQHNDMPSRVSEPSLHSQPCGTPAVRTEELDPLLFRVSTILCRFVPRLPKKGEYKGVKNSSPKKELP